MSHSPLSLLIVLRWTWASSNCSTFSTTSWRIWPTNTILAKRVGKRSHVEMQQKYLRVLSNATKRSTSLKRWQVLLIGCINRTWRQFLKISNINVQDIAALLTVTRRC